MKRAIHLDVEFERNRMFNRLYDHDFCRWEKGRAHLGGQNHEVKRAALRVLDARAMASSDYFGASQKIVVDAVSIPVV